MSRPLHSSHELPVEVERVYAVLSGPQWPARKAEVLRDGSQVVERVERPDGGVHLVVSRELPPGGPGFLERFLPSDKRVVQTDDWGPASGGVRSGTWQVVIPGVSARLGGTMRLEPAADGARYLVDGEISVPIPLVGGKAERFIAEMVGKLTAREAEVLQDAVQGPAAVSGG